VNSVPPNKGPVLRPPHLQPGDRVAVVAPAGPYDNAMLARGIAIWTARGFDVHVPERLDQREEYLAGSDWWRAEVLHTALRDPSIKALLCARGGYGSLRLFDRLEIDLFREFPKPLVGFSDITALQLECWRKTQLVTFSGPMIAGSQLGRLSEEETDIYFRTLTDPAPPPEMGGPDVHTVLSGSAEGILLGGNLTLLTHMAAAGRLPNLRGAILFFEDIHEAPYRVDRMLTTLRLGGHLDGVAGFAVGDLGDNMDDVLLDTILMDRVGDLGVPIAVGFPIGHGSRNRIIPLGVPVRLTTAPPGLQFLAGGVS